MAESYGKVSIIVPVYNTAKYLERSISSIINQTYQNLEIICVDDGSTDGSEKILDRLAEEDARIKVIHKQNEGVTAARNTALHMAVGDYIGFVDSDDYIDKEMYELLVKSLVENSVDIVTCKYYFDYNGVIKTAINKRDVSPKPMSIAEFLPYIYERDVFSGVGSYLWTRLFRRNVILNDDGTLNVEFRAEYGGTDDIVFVAEANMRSSKIVYLDKPLYYYFQRENSIVHDGRTQLATLHWVKSYEKILEIYDEHHVSEEVIRLIRRMYVYRCGKTLELAINANEKEKIGLLRENISKHLLSYFSSNLEHLDRIKWIVDLMLMENCRP